MLVGAYVGAAGALYLILMLLMFVQHWKLKPADDTRADLIRFTLRSLALSGTGLLAFVGLSTWAGIVRWGETADFHLPHDFTAHGTAGILILAVGMLGIVSPAAAALWSRRG